jgi:hypothetical protein
MVCGCTAEVRQSEADAFAQYRGVLQQFYDSDYLQREWPLQCNLGLEDESYIFFLAKLQEVEGGQFISCVRGEDYQPIEASDVLPEWDMCKEEPSSYSGLAQRVSEEIHHKPFPLVHLEDMVWNRSMKSYILVKRCHWLDEEKWSDTNHEYCSDKGDDCKIKSVAYAVLDERGKVYW